MYAIIESGGKQYRVEEGDVIDIELIEPLEGKVEFKNILLFHDGSTVSIGAPALSGITVHGEFVQEIKGPKVLSYKYKQRKNTRKKIGHRQKYSRIKITTLKG